MAPQKNTKSTETEKAIPYLLFLYQEKLKKRRRAAKGKNKIKNEMKYDLTKELVRANLTYICEVRGQVGRTHGTEIRQMWQELKVARNAKLMEIKKTMK